MIRRYLNLLLKKSRKDAKVDLTVLKNLEKKFNSKKINPVKLRASEKKFNLLFKHSPTDEDLKKNNEQLEKAEKNQPYY